jgi:hypothetical protein
MLFSWLSVGQDNALAKHLPNASEQIRGRSFDLARKKSLSGNHPGSRVLLDNSFTVCGTHYNNPRKIFVQLRYRFNY